MARILGYLAVVAATVSAVLAGAPTARAQPSDLDGEITTLQELIADVESGREIVLAPLGTSGWGTLVVVPRDRVGPMAGWLVPAGRLDPDSVESWTREQLKLSKGALEVMKKELAELEAKRAPSTTAPPGSESLTGGASGRWQMTSCTIQGAPRVLKGRVNFRFDGTSRVVGDLISDEVGGGVWGFGGSATGNGTYAGAGYDEPLTWSLTWDATFRRKENGQIGFQGKIKFTKLNGADVSCSGELTTAEATVSGDR